MHDSPHQFLPLLPSEHLLGPLRERAAKIINDSIELRGQSHPTTRYTLRELLRSMNSYYSNRIEGQSTTPKNIDAALHHTFSDEPEVAQLQRIAVAHIEAEKAVEVFAKDTPPLSAEFVRLSHHALYSRLEPGDRTTKDHLVVEPGRLRDIDVDVGRHVPPTWQSLPQFMERFTETYAQTHRSPETELIAIACAHHRMAWMHLFADGNGRATRLQTHAAMLPITHGLWSVNRGLARTVQDYYRNLAAADGPRQGDLDGRGNLTEKGLVQWVSYFLSVCEDQVLYMAKTLALDSMKAKITAAVQLDVANGLLRAEAALPIYHLFASGPATRGEFIQMTGLQERSGRRVLSESLKRGFVTSDTTHAPVRFAFPIDALPILLPNLYGAGE